MQKINLIAQGVLELSHRENADDNNDDDNDNDDDDTHQGWIIVRDGMYSVADKKWLRILYNEEPVYIGYELPIKIKITL